MLVYTGDLTALLLRLGVLAFGLLLFVNLADNHPFAGGHGHAVHTRIFRQREHEHAFPPLLAGITEALAQAGVGNQAADGYAIVCVQQGCRAQSLTGIIDKMKLTGAFASGFGGLCVHRVHKQEKQHCQPQGNALQPASKPRRGLALRHTSTLIRGG